MPRANLLINRALLVDVETSEIAPGARHVQAIGGGRYLPGRVTPPTLALALVGSALLRVIAARENDDELSIVTEDDAVYRLLEPMEVQDNVLRAELEFIGFASSQGGASSKG